MPRPKQRATAVLEEIWLQMMSEDTYRDILTKACKKRFKDDPLDFVSNYIFMMFQKVRPQTDEAPDATDIMAKLAEMQKATHGNKQTDKN